MCIRLLPECSTLRLSGPLAAEACRVTPALAKEFRFERKAKMRAVFITAIASATIAAAPAGPASAQETLTMSVPPVVSTDHPALLASDDPKLAANKRLVYDMYRIVLQAGLADRAHGLIAKDYNQHNPNPAPGPAPLV